MPVIAKNEMSSQEWRQNWARLIQKVYEADPLLCPKCRGKMRIIAFIEENLIIRKVLKHLGLWDTRNHGPPVQSHAHIPELSYDDDYSQIPAVGYWLQ